tara:strand:+ start:9971 stop:10765 length:795 start_codon:yes stop_codon:yes gene_type:complete
MAKYRQLHTTFWNDPLILDLTPEQKYFYIYLLTNPNVKQCGIYEISLRQITYHTGYNKETIEKLLDMFVNLNKIVISKKTNEIALINFLKYNYSSSPTIKKCIEKDLDEVKNKELIKYIYSIDSLDIEYVGNNKNNNNNNKKEKNNNKNELPNTEDSFKDYVSKLDNKEHHINFCDYWTEKNSAGKMRYQLEKTFSIEKRLQRWARNQFATSKKSGMPDFYDKAYASRIGQDQTQQKKYREHLISLGYEMKMGYAGEVQWLKRK